MDGLLVLKKKCVHNRLFEGGCGSGKSNINLMQNLHCWTDLKLLPV